MGDLADPELQDEQDASGQTLRKADTDLGADSDAAATWADTLREEFLNGSTAFAVVAGCVLYEMYRQSFFPLFQQNADAVPEWQPYLVIWVTAIVLKLLVQGKDSDIVLVIATLFLCLAGVSQLESAWSGFSNQVVLSVAVLGVVARGVEATGAVEKIFLFLLGKPRGFKYATVRLMIPAIVMNIGMSNTANMSILMPILEKWSLEVGISKNMFLMPLSFVLLISGTVAIFATSSNLIAQGLMIKNGQEPFTTFEIAPVAICATVACLVVVIFAMECLFPDFGLESEELLALRNSASAEALPDAATGKDVVLALGDGGPRGKDLSAPLLANDGGDKAVLSGQQEPSKDSTSAEPADLSVAGSGMLSRRSKPERTSKTVKTQVHKDTKRYVISVQLVSNIYVGKKLSEVDFLDGDRLACEAISVERFGQTKDVSDPEFVFKFYDILIMYTSSAQILALHRNPGFSVIQRDVGDPIPYRPTDKNDICEVVLDASCPLINQRISLSDAVRARYGACVLGVRPLSLTESLRGALSVNYDEKKVRRTVLEYTIAELKGRKYALGDTLVLLAASGFAERYEKSNDFFGVRTVYLNAEEKEEKEEIEEKKKEVSVARQIASLVILAGMVATVSTSTLPLLSACMSASVALTYTQCMTKEQAFNAIKIRTVLTIVGAFGLGDAIGNTKVAYLLASYVTDAMGPFGPPGLLVGIFLVTVMLGIVFHATAVVILMFPVCLESAHSLNVPVHQAVCILMIGAGCQMLSPVSYQTNLMAFSAGNYSFNDFPKLGLPIVILIGLVSIPMTLLTVD
eukprot:g8720.t1